MLSRVLLHRYWVPAVALVTLAAFVPSAMASMERYAFQGRTVGFLGWQTAEGGPDPSGRFRLTNARAASRERVDGSVLNIPIYLKGPAANLEVWINGALIDRVKLESIGWSQLNYDVINLLGKDRWSSKPMLTVEFRVRPLVSGAVAPADGGEMGVGIGEFRWRGPRPN